MQSRENQLRERDPAVDEFQAGLPANDELEEDQPAEQLKVFIRELIVHDDRDGGDGGQYDVHFGVTGDEDLVGNRETARWEGSVVSGQTADVQGWIGPVVVSTPLGVLSVAVAGVEHDLLSDDTVLGGVALLSAAQGWGTGSWWRTVNGLHCDFVFTVVREGGGDGDDGGDHVMPRWTGEAEDAPGPRDPTDDVYRAILG